MDTPSLFFLTIFVVPMVVFLFWIIKKDKKNRKWGYIVLSIIVIAALYTAFFKAPSYHELFPDR